MAKQLCFAHNHLTFAEYGLYVHLRELSSKNDYIYQFDDRSIAARFAPERGVSKDSCNRLRNALAEKGFIEWTQPLRRDSYGHFLPRLGRILSHGEHALKYPDSCAACTANATGASLTNSTGARLTDDTGPVANSPFSQSHQRDIKEISTKPDKKQNEIADRLLFPTTLSASEDGNSSSAPALKCGPPVASTLQAKSDSVPSTALGAVQDVQAFCDRFAAPDPSELPAPLKRLAELMECHVHVSQRLDELPNLERIVKLSPEDATVLFHWTIAEPFWGSRMSGRTALRFFCKHAPTIATQFNNSRKRDVARLKAASVMPNAAKPFQYAGDIL